MVHAHTADDRLSFVARLNGPWHERAMQAFMLVVLAHWAEHLLQTLQIYVLGWPVPEARGLVGSLLRVSLPGLSGDLSFAQFAIVVAYAIFMLGVCLLACVVPTRRALSVEPTVALRLD